MDEKFEILEKLRSQLNDSYLLDEVVMAMTTDQALDILKFVARMHDINMDNILNSNQY